MRYLLDTDTCIDIIRSKNDSVLRKVCSHELEQLSVSTITVAELEYGAAKSSRPEQNYLALTQFLTPMLVRDFDQKAAHCYGILRADLEKVGKRIGSLDMLIAAQALADGLVLITNNYFEFGRVKGLRTEGWHVIEVE